MFEAQNPTPETELPHEALHNWSSELTLLHDLLCAVDEADLALSGKAISALCIKLGNCADAIENIAWKIAPGGKPAQMRRAA